MRCARNGSPRTLPGTWNTGRSPSGATRPSRWPGWKRCSPTTGTPFANGCCGGCCMTPPPGPRRSSPWTSVTLTPSSGGPGPAARAATPNTCTGPPPPPGSCPGCWPAAPPGRCSWPAALASLGKACQGAGRHRPRQRARPPVLSPRGVPVQAGLRAARPARHRLDLAPVAAQRAQAPGRQRQVRSRTPGQEPPQAPRHPRALRPARRGDLRPDHRGLRPARPPPRPLTR